MTEQVLHFPDVYSGDNGINFGSSYIVAAKATQGSWYSDPYYGTYQRAASDEDCYFMAYHFLERGNAVKQAQFAYKFVGPRVPLAIDCESYLSSRPTITDVMEFVDAYRELGGICYILYLPRWYWQYVLNSPDLTELVQRNMWLWTSDYTTYSDDGIGWDGYGNMPVAIWQYSDSINYGGKPNVDFDAFKGTGTQTTLPNVVKEFARLVTTGILTANVT